MKVVLYFRIKEVRWTVGDDELRAAQARFPRVEFVRVTEDDELPAALADADVFFGFHFPPELFARAPRLRWMHSAAAGRRGEPVPGHGRERRGRSPTPPACTRSTSPSTPSAWCARSRATCTSPSA